MNSNKIDWLFETKALVVSPSDKPFLYTSGLIGPYYINTHYLCGGKETAASVLSFIDEKAEEQNFVADLIDRLTEVYEADSIFKGTIDSSAAHIEQNFPADSFEYISGGQRRDWFFSPLVARALKKPLLTIYNDGRVVDEKGQAVEELSGATVLNVADLLTVGSSIETKWIPAIAKRNGKLLYCYNVVDRRQGGVELLQKAGIEKASALFEIDKEFLQLAQDRDLITQEQFELVLGYLEDPFTSMREFLKANDQYISDVNNSEDEKTRKRAALLIGQNLYNL